MAVNYSWTTFTQRRLDFNLSKLFDAQQKDKKTPFENVDWTSINPIEQELKRRKIPENFLESLNT